MKEYTIAPLKISGLGTEQLRYVATCYPEASLYQCPWCTTSVVGASHQILWCSDPTHVGPQRLIETQIHQG